ncbi:upstream-binding factor 1-like protein 1 isoform X2 [Hyalella azteca]|uniref:Upstream-binding factor 1-like protein 1 isoform X2 n=1 Tax=Hyalella azteca TaxID=294128 RepID=A0A979FWT0_HYAAZ|nr:upstream-binding factor 1-like protein 1 isoform X2 [Hyalella azteca]
MSWPCFLTRRVVHQVWGFSRVTYCPAKKLFTQTSAVCGKMSIADELNLPDPPTKPLQPFAKFMSKGHKEYPHLSWTERIRLLSEIWNSQTQEQKKHLLNEYYEEKKQYQLKYKAYLSQLTPEQIQSIEEAVDRRKKSKERLLSKRGKKKEMERLNRPKQPENCFFLFLNTLRHDEPSTEKGDKDVA